MKIQFEGIGWVSKIAQKRSTMSLSINKLVAIGSGLEKGQEIYCYLARDKENRLIIITYLDGKKKCKGRVA